MRRILAAAIGCAIALGGLPGPAHAQPDTNDGKTVLEELRTAPIPKPQSDLDTVQLASAHRERADSLQEKTNGLWQSWLVSICRGCGADQKPAKPLRREDYPVRSVVPGTSTVSEAPKVDGEPQAAAPPAGKPEERKAHSSLTEDLSPANVSTIRRMPN